MKKHLFFLIFSVPFFGWSQTEKGIQFSHLSTWKQVMAQAQTSGKYIFVDLYATWCAPCKKMDVEVYPLEKVGDAANVNFTSVKIQTDRTHADNDVVRGWYKDADSLCKAYAVTAFPTFLFLSPDGKLILKLEAYTEPDSLIAVFKKVSTINPSTWQSTEAIRKEQIFYEQIKDIALKAKTLGHKKIANDIAEVYFADYLATLDDSLLFKKENLHFVTTFPELIRPNDHFFRFFYHEPKTADLLVRAGYSSDIVRSVVRREEIENKLFSNGVPLNSKPDWGKIAEEIGQKYDKSLATSLTNRAAQIAYYSRIKDWQQYARLINESIKQYAPEINGHILGNEIMTGVAMQRDDWSLNGAAWTIFQCCNDKSILKNALQWCDLSIKISGNDGDIDAKDQYYDTKANLLYKLGDIKQAIQIEKQGYELAKRAGEKAGVKDNGKEYLETIETMKKGQPTWPVANKDNK